jgi:type I restriction enzyme S subunit
MNGELPEGWKTIPFLDAIDYRGGSQPPKKDFVFIPKNGYVRLLQIRDFGDKPFPTYVPDSKRLKKVSSSDLLLARYGGGSESDTLGRVCTGLDGAYNVALAKLIINEAIIDKGFAKVYFMGPWFKNTVNRNSRSCQTGFNRNDLKDLEIPVPPISEQRRIVAKVESLLADVSRAKERLANLPRLLKRIQLSLLASACSGNLTKDIRQGDKKSKDISENNPEGFVDIPPSWKWQRLKDVADIRGGIQKQPMRAPRKNAYPYLRVANVMRGALDIREVQKMELYGNELETYRLAKDDILIVEGNGSIGEIGRSAVWGGQIKDCVHQNHIIRVRPRGCLSSYIDMYWNSPFGIERVTSEAVTTSGLYSLSVGKIAALSVPVPPLSEQIEIVRRVDCIRSILKHIASNAENALNATTNTSKVILAKAFSGELVPTESELSEA